VPDDPVEEVDFFTDMTPSVSRQARVYVGPSSKATPGASRLGVHGQADGLVEVRSCLRFPEV
jgi:hypothetical protein